MVINKNISIELKLKSTVIEVKDKIFQLSSTSDFVVRRVHSTPYTNWLFLSTKKIKNSKLFLNSCRSGEPEKYVYSPPLFFC